MDICIDFDGTCVTHEFPNIGKDIGAAPILKELINNGHRLILFTMRSDIEDTVDDKPNVEGQVAKYGNFLAEALGWFSENKIELYGIQENPNQKTWTKSPKAYGQLYIDDAALGIPLTFDLKYSERHYVDWIKVRKLLVEQGLLPLINN